MSEMLASDMHEAWKVWTLVGAVGSRPNISSTIVELKVNFETFKNSLRCFKLSAKASRNWLKNS
jgi:hypothetical protein